MSAPGVPGPPTDARAPSTDPNRMALPRARAGADTVLARIRLDVHVACDRLESATAHAGIAARAALGGSADLDHARRLAGLASRLAGAAHAVHRLLDDLPASLDPARSAAPTQEDPS